MALFGPDRSGWQKSVEPCIYNRSARNLAVSCKPAWLACEDSFVRRQFVWFYLDVTKTIRRKEIEQDFLVHYYCSFDAFVHRAFERGPQERGSNVR